MVKDFSMSLLLVLLLGDFCAAQEPTCQKQLLRKGEANVYKKDMSPSVEQLTFETDSVDYYVLLDALGELSLKGTWSCIADRIKLTFPMKPEIDSGYLRV